MHTHTHALTAHPPARSMRSRSAGSVALWSVVSDTASPARHTTARQSPTLASTHWCTSGAVAGASASAGLWRHSGEQRRYSGWKTRNGDAAAVGRQRQAGSGKPAAAGRQRQAGNRPWLHHRNHRRGPVRPVLRGRSPHHFRVHRQAGVAQDRAQLLRRARLAQQPLRVLRQRGGHLRGGGLALVPCTARAERERCQRTRHRGTAAHRQ